MNKQTFLDVLRQGLAGLPQDEAEERLSFYSEMIDDYVEEGLTEEEAVSRIGSVDEIVSQTISDIPLTKLVKEKVTPKRSLKAWEIVLIVLGFPIWFSLLVAAVSVIFSLYITLWSLIVCLWAAEFAVAVSVIGCFAGAVLFFIQDHAITGVAAFGAGLFCAGLAVFLFVGCVAATKGMAVLTKKIAIGIKSLFIGKENRNA